MPNKPSLWFKWKRTIKIDLNFILIDGASILGVYNLIEVLLISSFSMFLRSLDRKSTMIPFPIIFNHEVYHTCLPNIAIK
jgi:hypothetical protein